MEREFEALRTNWPAIFRFGGKYFQEYYNPLTGEGRWCEITPEYAEHVLNRGVERSQTRTDSDDRAVDLSGAVHGGCGGVELHGDGCDGVLQPDVLVEDVRSGTRTNR